MKKNNIVALTLLAGFGWALQADAEEAAHHHGTSKSGNQTIQGEVLDMACYMAHEGKGSKHKKCAEQCVKGGAPIGLLTKDGQVYLLTEDHNAPKPFQQIKTWAAEQVSVTGEVVNRGGVQAMIVKSSEKN